MDGAPKDKAGRIARQTAVEDTNLFGRISAAAMASRADAKRHLDAAGRLSIPEWRILWNLYDAGPLSLQDMATLQRTDHSLISRAIRGMRQKGYVTIERDHNDKRASIASLTDLGCHAYSRAAPIMKDRRNALAACFSDAEMAQFLVFIERFEAHVSHPRKCDVEDAK